MNTHFSVIMPTYNQASFIRRAILSLQRQTYPNWELIIINDGCTDDTEMFISDFLNDERIVYIKNESNKGLGYALNQGLKIARNELIAYLPSEACPDMEVEGKVMKAINEVKSFDVLSGGGIGFYSADGTLVMVLVKK